MKLNFLITDDFLESLKRLDKPIQEMVKEKLRFFSESEYPLNFAKKLKGQKRIFRFRAGDYRIVFRLDQTSIILLNVKHRKDVYEEF